MGGCSSINGMIYIRGQAADYDHWRQLGNPGWGWDDVLPLFRKSEDHHTLSGPFHGQGGELRVDVVGYSRRCLGGISATGKAIAQSPDGIVRSMTRMTTGFQPARRRRNHTVVIALKSKRPARSRPFPCLVMAPVHPWSRRGLRPVDRS
ncbi:GMC family oxidoreductase N-terminal domain-containing protein [Mesorhizobium sp. VK9D]|nr:GMC family oxidoreductase N-terminal domain-containing protein [Mesorhizobium sp. VK9D]MDX8455336.1 GMC family oxidoreductase N-terminal domain-containing protein [Mesorhizobium sp. VK9D]